MSNLPPLGALWAESISQGQAFAQANSSSSAPAGATGSVGLTVATAITTIPPIISPSLGALTFVVNNLVQLGQMQIADIMPLDNGPTDAVAILLVVSGTSGEVTNGQDLSQTISRQGEDNNPPEPESLADRTTRTAASNLERFLANWDRRPGRPIARRASSDRSSNEALARVDLAAERGGTT